MGKARYRSAEVPCTVRLEGDDVVVEFDEPQRAITPGQALVFYDGEYVIGGGTIGR
jgi:tRNA-specific 2-thiouridylase